MKKYLAHPWTLLALRIVLGGLFVYAGIIKFADPVAFADSITTYQLLPASLINLVAFTLPPLEIAAGLMLITGYHARLGAFTIGILCVVFLVALTQAFARGLEVDCGCFGSVEPSASQTLATIGRDILFLGAATWIYWSAVGRSRTHSHGLG